MDHYLRRQEAQTAKKPEAKRGCQAGALARLKRRLFKLPLPSIFLSNACSIANTMDELKLHMAADKYIQDYCILVITEMWPHPLLLDTTIQLAGHRPTAMTEAETSLRAKEGVMHLHQQRLVYKHKDYGQALFSCPGISDCQMQNHLPPTRVYCGQCCVYSTVQAMLMLT